MIISIDHGNKQIKTIHKTFTSGLCESDTRPPFGENVLFYNGKYYTLSDQRIPYMRDKTADERFFILTLFAIGFELRRVLVSEHPVKIQLCIGLPPAHYGTLYKKFEQYFLERGQLDFRIDGTPYSILITEAECFPQAYAAAIPVFQKLQQLPRAIIVDIGGFTADYLQIKYGEVDLSVCDSLENGVIVLYNRIRSKINADFDMLLEESDIDAILMDKADFDFEARTVTIDKNYARLDKEDLILDPKTPKSNRTIGLPGLVCDMVKEYASRLVDYKDGDRLFDVTKHFLYHEMERVSKQSGVKKIRIHDIRHSHASLLIELGENILLISERLGHENVQTTLEIYGHLYPNKDGEIAGRLDGLCA